MLSQAPEEVRQDHVCVILLQNWTMAVDANIRITFRHCSLISKLFGSNLQNSLKTFGASAFCPVFLWQIDTQVGQIRQRRKHMSDIIMLDIISLVTPEILEANKSDLFQCTLGEAHAVIAVCWIDSLLPYTYKLARL